MSTEMKNGDRVKWKESSWKEEWCTGTVVSNNLTAFGERTDFYTVAVDEAFYLKACRTATEMNLGWVNRSTKWNQLKLIE